MQIQRMRCRGCAAWVLVSAILLISLSTGTAQEKRIITSLYPLHIATINVTAGVPGILVTNMAPATAGCLHDYRLSADDMVRISKADVLIINGMGAEVFLDGAMKHFGDLKVINASEGIEPLVEGREVNPHVWLSVELHRRQVVRIAEGLAAADREHAKEYLANAETYARRLQELHGRLCDGLKKERQRNVVTFHDAFPYFAREYGFVVVAVVERHPGSQPSARELRKVIEEIRGRDVQVVFAEPQYPASSAEVIARESGASVLLLDPIVSGPLHAGAYIEIMDRNLATLQQAFRASGGMKREERPVAGKGP